MTTENRPARVLVVDDEPIISDTLALIFRGQGIDSRAVYSGEDAAQVALDWKPEVVITDVLMGSMDGVALAIYISQILPSCRVLLISGNPDTDLLIEAAEKGGHTFPILAKPFQVDAIFEFLGGTQGHA